MTNTQINKIVSKHFEVSVSDIQSNKMDEKTIMARSAAMLLTHYFLKSSSKCLCQLYQKKAHSTILHALRVAKNMIDTNTDYKRLFYAAQQEIIEYEVTA